MEADEEFNSEDDDYGDMVAAQNRRNKKAGGFQAMGKNPIKTWSARGNLQFQLMILGLDHAVFKGISKKGYKVPTPIQRKVSYLLPISVALETDILRNGC